MRHGSIVGRPGSSVAILVAGTLIAAFLVWFVPSKILPISWDFRNGLWGPAYLLLHRQSPYNIHVLFAASNCFWMPVIIGFFLPIGFLPLQWASNIWLLLNLGALYLTVAVLAETSGKSIAWIVLATLALVIFPSSLEVLRQGQVSLIVCAVLVVLSKHRKQLSPVISGGLLAISLTKPQLVILFLPAYLVVCLREQGSRKVLRVGIWMLGWIALLCLPLFLLYPNWIPGLRQNLAINLPWFYPSLYSYLEDSSLLHSVAVPMAGVYLAIGMGLVLLAAMRLDGFEALLWTAAVTPAFSPVIWSWDFVLVYPLLVFMVLKHATANGSYIIYWGYGSCALAFILMRILGIVLDQYTFWVPLFLNAVILLGRGLSTPVPQNPAST